MVRDGYDDDVANSTKLEDLTDALAVAFEASAKDKETEKAKKIINAAEATKDSKLPAAATRLLVPMLPIQGRRGNQGTQNRR